MSKDLVEKFAKHSVEDITSAIIRPATAQNDDTVPANDAEDELSPNQGEELENQEFSSEEGDEEENSDDVVTQDEDEDASDEGTSDEDDDEEDVEAANDDTNDDNVLEINDDDMIEVVIDGETVLRSISDAKKALSGEGAIEKRLEEATKAKQKLVSDHTQLLQSYQAANSNFTDVVTQLHEAVTTPLVSPPPDHLQHSDPAAYIKHLNAYNNDQKRISQIEAQLQEAIQQQQEAVKERTSEYQEQQTAILQERLPELFDNQKSGQLLTKMNDVAVNKYGFTPEELQQVQDARYYLVLADLAKYHSAKGTVTRRQNTVKTGKRATDVPRKLRSGATKAKAAAAKRAKEQQQAVERARQTGSTKDIARTLIKPR